MRSFRFQANGRELAATLHGAGGGCAVVLCNPFGREAATVRPLQRQLAERLAADGLPALRVDWYGCGDSMGDDLDGDLDGWREDLLAADAWLRKQTGCKRTIWLGIRLGATLAVLASMRASADELGLVLWEPVTDGGAYLSELQRDQQRVLQVTDEGARRAMTPAANELGGVELSERLHRQLSSLLLFGRVLRVPSVVVGPTGHPAMSWRAAPPVAAPRLVTLARDWRWGDEDHAGRFAGVDTAVALLVEGVKALR